MTKYFIIEEGSQAGPFSPEELLSRGLTPESLVWTAGLPDWVAASTIPELTIIMNNARYGTPHQAPNDPSRPFNPYGSMPGAELRQPQDSPEPHDPGCPPFDPYSPNMPQPIPHTNWLPWAIAATVAGAIFSCLGMIFGIIGIVKANKANSFYARGMAELGNAANSSARTMVIIGLVLAALGLGIIGIGWFLDLPDFSPFSRLSNLGNLGNI